MNYRKKSPRRAADESNTLIVNHFLDKYFYTEENGFSDVKRIDERELQVKGVDVEFSFKDKHYFADEKAATSYINKGLRTFSLELAFVNARNEIMDGWFLNEGLMTDSYVFVWIDEGDVVPFLEGSEIDVLCGINGIKVADVALIEKSKILDYLSSLGWSKDNLRTKCDNILTEPEKENMGNLYKNGCKFSYSSHLVEEPVNVIIPREKIIELSTFHLHVDKNNCK